MVGLVSGAPIGNGRGIAGNGAFPEPLVTSVLFGIQFSAARHK